MSQLAAPEWGDQSQPQASDATHTPEVMKWATLDYVASHHVFG